MIFCLDMHFRALGTGGWAGGRLTGTQSKPSPSNITDFQTFLQPYILITYLGRYDYQFSATIWFYFCSFSNANFTFHTYLVLTNFWNQRGAHGHTGIPYSGVSGYLLLTVKNTEDRQWCGFSAPVAAAAGAVFWNLQPLLLRKPRTIRTPNEGINQRYLKNWADVADKICFCCT